MKLVKIERSVKNEALGIKRKEAFNVPTPETYDEAVKFVGGEASALEIIVQYISTRAPASAITSLSKSKTQEEYDQELAKQQANVEKWSPSVLTGPTQKAVYEQFSDLETFRAKRPEIWSMLTIDEGFAILTKARTLQEVLASRGIEVPTE